MAKANPRNTVLNDRLAQVGLMYDIASAMNRSPSTRDLLNTILDKCIELTDATSGSVMLIDEKSGCLDIRAHRGLKKDVAARTRLKIGEGVTGWVAKHGKPLLVNDTTKDRKYVQVRKDIVSELAVPIRSDDKVIGVVNVDSNRKNIFNETYKDFLVMVAELAAQVFIKDGMKERIESKYRSQEVLISAFEVLEQKNDLSAIFNEVMDILKDRMKILRGMLVLFDPEDPSVLKINVGYKLSGEAVSKGIYRIGEGIIGTSVLKGKTVACEDILKDPNFLNRMRIHRHGQGPISFFASPVRIDNRTLGVLAMEKKFEDSQQLDDTVSTLTILTSILAYKVKNFLQQQQRTARLLDENRQLKKALRKDGTSRDIIGKDPKIIKVIEQVNLTANTMASVLITGETGTGKELIARELHNLSDRNAGPFVSINCSAVPENLLEAELFGHEKGAFTGAVSAKKGKFELAHNGTLFLDEIGDMPPHLQVKILRALEEKEIQPLGSEKSVRVNIRVIAATNRDLEKMVGEEKFRSDLFFRLNVINIHLPALRERRDDILLLAEFFLERYTLVYGKNIRTLSDEVRDIFLGYGWPGNIRELENAIERAVILCPSDLIDTTVLPAALREEDGQSGITDIRKWVRQRIGADPGKDVYERVIGEAEKELIEEMLIRMDYNRSRTADVLGINRNTLKDRMDKYKIS